MDIMVAVGMGGRMRGSMEGRIKMGGVTGMIATVATKLGTV